MLIARGELLDLGVGSASATGGTNPEALTGGVVSRCSSDYPAEIAEVLAVKGTLADPDVTNLEAYFNAKASL